MYHRTWEVREPVEIRILPDCIEIINKGIPDRSVKLVEIQKGIIRSKRYRYQQIGDFLKELDMKEGNIVHTEKNKMQVSKWITVKRMARFRNKQRRHNHDLVMKLNNCSLNNAITALSQYVSTTARQISDFSFHRNNSFEDHSTITIQKKSKSHTPN